MLDLTKALWQAKISIALEGLFVTQCHQELVVARLQNRLTEEEFQLAVKRMVNGG